MHRQEQINRVAMAMAKYSKSKLETAKLEQELHDEIDSLFTKEESDLAMKHLKKEFKR